MVRYGILVLVGLALVVVGTLWAALNFPQEYATEFYLVKGMVGMMASGLLIFHMDRAWGHMTSGAQMGRYLMLLFGTIVAGAGSVSQISHHDEVRLQNIGGLEFLIGVCAVMVYSIIDDRRKHP